MPRMTLGGEDRHRVWNPRFQRFDLTEKGKEAAFDREAAPIYGSARFRRGEFRLSRLIQWATLLAVLALTVPFLYVWGLARYMSYLQATRNYVPVQSVRDHGGILSVKMDDWWRWHPSPARLYVRLNGKWAPKRSGDIPAREDMVLEGDYSRKDGTVRIPVSRLLDRYRGLGMKFTLTKVRVTFLFDAPHTAVDYELPHPYVVGAATD